MNMGKGLDFIREHLNDAELMRDLYDVTQEFWECDKFDRIFLAIDPYFIDKVEQYNVGLAIKKELEDVNFNVSVSVEIVPEKSEEELHKLYHSHKGECSVCGTVLESAENIPLGSVFVLDKHGRFYCTHHDSKFEDGDERIYDEE